MQRIIRLMLMVALGLLPVAGNAKSITVPLRFYGTRPAVEVTVQGHGPFLFLVDTGAGGPPARADASLVRRLGLPRQGQASSTDGGASVDIDKVTIPNVKLGSFDMSNVAALSRDYGSNPYLPRLDGILGPAFFKDRLLTIDYVHATLTIGDGELPPADGRSILDYAQPEEGGLWIPVSIGGQSAKAVLDTGNIRALDLPAEAVKPLRMASFPRLAGNSTSVSGTTTIREVALAAPLRIGHHALERPAVTFSEDFHEWNIGSAMLQDFVITIDQKNRRVRLARSTK